MNQEELTTIELPAPKGCKEGDILKIELKLPDIGISGYVPEEEIIIFSAQIVEK